MAVVIGISRNRKKPMKSITLCDMQWSVSISPSGVSYIRDWFNAYLHRANQIHAVLRS